MSHKSEENWPEKRANHAATCVATNTSHTQILISGGVGKWKVTYADMWLLDVTSMTWKKVRYYHTLFMCIIYEDVITIIK